MIGNFGNTAQWLSERNSFIMKDKPIDYDT